ncbi:hypothetical protein Droror1_Dr00012216 [Drosera rotundifolia]
MELPLTNAVLHTLLLTRRLLTARKSPSANNTYSPSAISSLANCFHLYMRSNYLDCFCAHFVLIGFGFDWVALLLGLVLIGLGFDWAVALFFFFVVKNVS